MPEVMGVPGFDDGQVDIDLDPRAEFEESCPTFDEPIMTVELGPGSRRVTRVGCDNYQVVRSRIKKVLTTNSDLFSWSLADMPGIDPDFMCHKLALLPQARPMT